MYILCSVVVLTSTLAFPLFHVTSPIVIVPSICPVNTFVVFSTFFPFISTFMLYISFVSEFFVFGTWKSPPLLMCHYVIYLRQGEVL